MTNAVKAGRLPVFWLMMATIIYCAHDANAQAEIATPAGEAVIGPKIVADPDTHDFGQVSEGSVVSHTFLIFNEGDVPLRILGAKGG